MGAAHILSKARNAAVTFSKLTPGRIFPELQRSHPAALSGLELRPKVCGGMCRRDLDQIPLQSLFYRGRNWLVRLPSPGLSAPPYHQPKRGELGRASDCCFQKKCLSQASALEASVLVYAVFHMQEDITHLHSGEIIPD